MKNTTKLIILIGLVLPAICFGATDRTVAVYPSGASAPGGFAATYTSLVAAEAAEDGDLTAGGGTRLIIEIVESDGSWSGAPDTGFVDWDGWTTDRTSGEYVLVRTVGGARSSTGLWDTTAYIINGSGSSVETMDVDNDFNVGGGAALDIEFEGLQIDHPANNFPAIRLAHNGALSNDVRLTKSYVRQAATNVGIHMRAGGDPTVRIKNCIIENTGTGTEGIRVQLTGPTVLLYNNTIFGWDINGVQTDGTTFTSKNNAVFDTANDFLDAFTVIDFNASDDVDGTNTVDISPAGETEAVRWDEAFTDYTGSQDVTIKDTDSVLYIAGLDQDSDSEIPSDDINGTTRPSGASAVSIGAFEFAVGNSAPTITSIDDYPDPEESGNDVTFSVDWNDADTEGIKMLACKTDSITAATPVCDGGEWCSDKNDYDSTDPITCTYTLQAGDLGSNDYYVFVCDDEPECSASTSGTFTVQALKKLRLKSILKIKGGKIKIK